MVVSLGGADSGLRAVAAAVKFHGYQPRYGLPPLHDQHHAEALGDDTVS